jgi:hypothetical protein
VTDRALRYRAQRCAPDGPRICGFCGSTENVDLHHIDGFEEHVETGNLMYACRSCNVRVGVQMAYIGLGRPTRQMNPATQGAKSLGQWLTAVRSAKGEIGDMDVAAAVAMIRATPPKRRSEFAQQIWEIRRRRGTDRKA